jgi:hypothetical protein
MFRQSGSEGILAKALDDLEKKWAITADGWRDKAREDFDLEHLEEMRRVVKMARSAMRNVDELISQVSKECS